MIRLLFVITVFGIAVILSEISFNFPSNSFNTIRFYSLSGGGNNCLKELELYSNEFKPLGTFVEGNCKVKNAVEITSFKNTKFSEQLTLSCPTALNVGKYFNNINAKTIDHLGTYNCRNIAGSEIVSEHSYGTAIDISKIDSASVLKDWNKNSDNGKILENAYDVACQYFSNILTPDTNNAHNNHFHFDNGFGTKCYLKGIKK